MSVQSELVVLTFANKFLGPLFLCTKSFDNKVLKLPKNLTATLSSWLELKLTEFVRNFKIKRILHHVNDSLSQEQIS